MFAPRCLRQHCFVSKRARLAALFLVAAMSTSAAPLSQSTVDFLARPRYTQATYVGRVRHFFATIDPRTLLATQSDIDKAVALIQQYKAGKREGVTQEQIWKAKKIQVQTSKQQCAAVRTVLALLRTVSSLVRSPSLVPLM